MVQRLLGINPTTEGTGTHDPSAVLFENGDLVFGAEEERFDRQKHSRRTFPSQAIKACLDYSDATLSEVDKILIGWKPKSKAKHDAKLNFRQPTYREKGYRLIESIKNYISSKNRIELKLSKIGTPVPPIETCNHHRCHAATAFAPSGFDEAIIVSIDGRGEAESTVVWEADNSGFTRIRTYEFPNSLGAFYGTITSYLGYRYNNGEGKIMGLAPYGRYDQKIEDKLLQLVSPGIDYDVAELNYHTGQAISKLESLFDRPKRSRGGEFSDWEKNLACTCQQLLEETVVEIIETYCREYDMNKVGLAGGVALNCKMNKRVMESDVVDELFVQPISHDAGCAIGAGILETGLTEFDKMSTVYWGPKYTTSEIKEKLDQFKLTYYEPDNLEQLVAERLASGELVGWFQGRLEMGPRALGNRSILADSTSPDSRDRLNRFVKHREEWRPFAPSLLEEAADEYLLNGESAPYMIKTFDVKEGKKDKIPAVLHKGDKTTRPQTVNKNQNPRYHQLIQEFESLTGVPVILNTSFNDHGEPIVNKPKEAIKDFFAMGLDLLVLEDIVIEKPT